MMLRFLSLFFISIIFLNFEAIGQKDIDLEKMFKNYEILNVDSRAVYNQIASKRNGEKVILQLTKDIKWNFNLENSNIIDDNYFLKSVSQTGETISKGTTALPMKGKVVGIDNSNVSLTFNKNFIYGLIEVSGHTYFIEPMTHYIKDAPKDQFILYSNNDIIDKIGKKCGYDIYMNERAKTESRVSAQRLSQPGGCFIVDIALASDHSMVLKYGSVGAVEDHNIGVLNNVQTNYDNEFADEIQFNLTTQWVSSCSGCDPWSSSTDSGVLLSSFRSWATAGFGATHAVGSLWSNRDFDDSTIGLAWLGSVCTSFKYNVLQDFTSNASLKRVLQAHEIGHNFDATHTSGIMAPSVSTATNWTTTNINEIEAYYLSANCLSSCGSSQNPTASFSYFINTTCNPASITFDNNSTNSTSYLWTFGGGSPSTSTQTNPTVTFTSTGTYTITLQASNGTTSSSFSLDIFLEVVPAPTSNFTFSINGQEASFFFGGENASNYNWSFGNGNNSTDQNPTNYYAINGSYNVTLNTSNQCGNSTTTKLITINVLPVVDFTVENSTICQTESVTFTNNSTNAISYFWTFQGGTPETSTLENPIVTYNLPGIYNVKLEATNSAGTKSLVKNSFISVNPNPIAGFSQSVSSNVVSFSNSSQNATTYLWNFGDGNTSTSVNPIHTYLNNGTYNVTQTAFNSCGSNSITSTIIIAKAPVASFTSNYINPICKNESVTFNNSSAFSPTSFLWTFEGGIPSTSTDQNPSVVYAQVGTFDVTLTVTNVNGSNSITLPDYVLVDSKPEVNFNYSSNNFTVSFNQNIINGSAFSWSFGDGNTSIQMNPSHTFSNAGTYTVVLTDQNNCGVSSFSQAININLAPTASFNADTTLICSNGNIQYNSQTISSSSTSWLWTFEGGSPATSSLQNPIVQYSIPGTYDATLTVSNAFGQNTLALADYVTVLDLPTASFTGTKNNNIIELANTGNGATSTFWKIINGSNIINMMGDSVTVSTTRNGQYQVIMTNQNQCGQVVSDTAQYNINVFPSSSFSINDGSVACARQPVNYFASGSNYTFQWNFPGAQPNASTLQNPNVSYVLPGTYTVQLISSNAFGNDTLNTSVLIGDVPKTQFAVSIANNQAQFTNNTINANNYLWQFGDGNTSTSLNPIHTYSNSGNYLVNLIATNSCGVDTTTNSVLFVLSAVSEELKGLGIEIYPNPASDKVFVKMNSGQKINVDFEIIDYSGKILNKTKFIVVGETTIPIDTETYISGLYFLRLRTESGSAIYKLVISN